VKPSIVLRPVRWLLGHRRRGALILGLALLLVLLAHPGALADDVFGNISPAPQLPPGGWVGRYPVEHYSLDQYFPAISVGFTSGVDASGVAPMIAYFGAQMIWLLTSFLANGVILLFALAFNLNLLTGNGTPGSGALTPISQAIHNLYANTFGTPWLIAVVTLVGCWAMWKALVQRRYTETAGALAVSLIYFILAIGIVTQPEQTIAPVSKLSNEMSTAILSLTSEGNVGNEEKAKTGASNQLFELLVLNPWTVLEFGGLEHCATVEHGKAHSVAVQPLSSNSSEDTRLASELENGTEVTGQGGKVCINNRNKYATHFLAYPFQSKERGSEHEALEHGDDEDLPESDPGKTSGTYPLGPADEPAAEAAGKGGQYQRLGLAIVIVVGEVGAYLLLGALALGVILAQILLLALLAFAPVALLIGIFPGRGHEFFRSWLGKLAGYLARKVIYSLILAVVLAVCSALDSATGNLGWLLAFGLQAAFLWTIFLQRNKLTQDLMGGTVGHRGDDGNRLANLYFASRLARNLPSLPRVPGLPKLPSRSGPGAGASESEPPAGGEGPQPGGAAPPEAGSPQPPSDGPATGAGSGTFLPPAPGSHETPTHGQGSPYGAGTPSQDDHPAPLSPSPDDGPLPLPSHPGVESPQDELPSAEPRATQAPPGTRESPSREPADEHPAADRPAPSTVSSTGQVSHPVVHSTRAQDSSAPKDSPRPIEPPAPATAQPPHTPAATAAPTPGTSRTSSPDDALGEDIAPARNPPRSADVARPDARHDESMPPAVEAPSPTQEPVARLLKARQSPAPTDPANPEDELA
jgi:hypothetical protein